MIAIGVNRRNILKVLSAVLLVIFLLTSILGSVSTFAAVSTRTIYRVTTNSLNLRSTAKIERNNRVGSLRKNEEVILLGRYGSWSKIQTRTGKTGYVDNRYIKYYKTEKINASSVPSNKPSQPTIPSNQSKGTMVYSVTTNVLNFRSTPKVAQNNLISLLKRNEKVYLIQTAGEWSKIKTMNGRIGYVSKKYIKYEKTINTSTQPTTPTIPTKPVQPIEPNVVKSIVDTTKALYTYEEMVSDIGEIKGKYKDKVKVESIGSSVMGKDIISVIIGNPDAEKKIMIYGSTHGCEYMTTQLMMKQLEFYLDNYETGQYNNVKYNEILDQVSIYFIPSLNPDGVALSQMGTSWIKDEELKAKLIKINKGSTNFYNWKATITGVNLNSNFDYLWDLTPYYAPTRTGNRGTGPESEPESKAIANYTRQKNFNSVISYHAMGSIIYWYYYQTGANYNRDKALANELKAMTGYTLVPESSSAGYAGYRNWYIMNFGKPAFTIEIGSPSSRVPLEISQFPRIWNENKLIPMHLAYKVFKGEF